MPRIPWTYWSFSPRARVFISHVLHCVSSKISGNSVQKAKTRVSKHEILNPGFRLVFRAEFLKIVVWHQYWGIPSSQIRESRAWSRGVNVRLCKKTLSVSEILDHRALLDIAGHYRALTGPPQRFTFNWNQDTIQGRYTLWCPRWEFIFYWVWLSKQMPEQPTSSRVV